MAKIIAKDVDDYIRSSRDGAKPLLQEIRKVIKSTVPKAEECIAWGVPFYKYDGPLAGIAAFKSHVTFGFAFGDFDYKHRKMFDEKGYTTGVRTVKIKFDQKAPVSLLKLLLKQKIKERDDKKKVK